ncbi:DUF6773 family protein [Lysinibacillus sp. 54212]|uniref:DUF6773 family protein n=1 Tax=Lysinibacillus sp. 54212 TaxID=3119829 RepID=UPI002FC7CFFA
MFKRKKFSDERVTNMQNKIYREIFTIITVICFVSIAIKFLTIGKEFNLIITETIILILSGVYYLFRSVKMGIFSEEVEISNANSKFKYSTRTMAIGIIYGLFLSIIFGVNSAFNYADSTAQAIEYFFIVFLVSLIIYIPGLLIVLLVPYSMAKSQSDKVNRKMLDELDDEA